MVNRTRKIVLRVPVTPEERELIEQKMSLLHTKNFSAYARKMLIDGYIIKVDYTEQKKLAAAVSRIATNINRVCRRCVHDCTQSFRAVVVICPHYQSKRAKRVAHLRTPLADLTENRHSSRITPDQRGCDEKSISN